MAVTTKETGEKSATDDTNNNGVADEQPTSRSVIWGGGGFIDDVYLKMSTLFRKNEEARTAQNGGKPKKYGLTREIPQ